MRRTTSLLSIILATFVLAPASPGLASPNPRVEAIFESVFHHEEVYVPLACHLNTLELLRRFQLAGVPLGNMKVVYVMSVTEHEGRLLADGKKIRAYSTREGEREWNFHVVLEANGDVIDFDYTRSPRIVRARDYYLDQFGAKGVAELGVRVIPARVYLREYSESFDPESGEVRNWAYFLHDVGGRFPAVRLSRLLAR